LEGIEWTQIRGWFGSCLNIAISKLQFYLVRDLLKKGAGVVSCDVFKNDPMHYLFTVYGNNPHDAQQIAQLLLTNNCDPNHRNDRGFTPLHIAIIRGI
jgi:ankyrin repeat protein